MPEHVPLDPRRVPLLAYIVPPDDIVDEVREKGGCSLVLTPRVVEDDYPEVSLPVTAPFYWQVLSAGLLDVLQYLLSDVGRDCSLREAAP